MLDSSCSFFPEMTTEEKIDFILGGNGSKPYHELGLLQKNSEGLKFAADLVYIYPADLFFETLFFKQFGKVMTKPDFLVAVMTGSTGEDTIDAGSFEKKYSLPLSFSSCLEMRLDIFGRRPID